MPDRPTIEVPTPAGGWGQPWPNVAEIERAFTHDRWTLVGGLMAQLHCMYAGFSPVRPTNDVDIVRVRLPWSDVASDVISIA